MTTSTPTFQQLWVRHETTAGTRRTFLSSETWPSLVAIARFLLGQASTEYTWFDVRGDGLHVGFTLANGAADYRVTGYRPDSDAFELELVSGAVTPTEQA